MKTFEIFESKQTIVERKQIATFMNLVETAIKILDDKAEFAVDDPNEPDKGLEFTPDPKFKGVKGVSTDTGPGIQARKAAEKKAAAQRIADQWPQFITNYMRMHKKGDPQTPKAYQRLEKLAAQLQQMGKRVEMPPRPAEERIGDMPL